MFDINVAKYSGFCFGVRFAYEKAMGQAEKGSNVVMLGDIVHNEHVVERIDKAGVKVVNELSSDNPGTLLLRAHGAEPEVYKEAEAKNYTIIDATCPLVHDIHEIARNLDKDGYKLIIIGDYDHDEVIGIAGQVKDAVTIANPEDFDEKMPKKIRKVGVVVQSTQNIENVQKIVAKIVTRCHELRFFDTICKPTKLYQGEIRKMPLVNDVMIIVGSFTSANTKRLTEISLSLNPRSYQVESGINLNAQWFADAKTVGVTAGASTPDWIIEEVVEKLKSISN